MLRVFVFVILITWTSASFPSFSPIAAKLAVMDDFDHFCSGHIEGNILNDPDQPGESICQKTLDLPNITDDIASSVCKHRSRFAVKSGAIDKNKNLTCTWHKTGKCPEGQYIDGYCYKFFATCSGDWKPTRWRDLQAFRWISFTYSGYKVAKFELPAKYPKPTKKYTRNTLVALKPGENPGQVGVILDRMPAFGGYPGDLIYYPDSEQPPLAAICRKESFGDLDLDGATQQTIPIGVVTNHGLAAYGGAVIKAKDKKYKLRVSSNVYSPKLNSKGRVDLTYFHSICENICENCFAATPPYLDPSKLDGTLPKGRFWMPGARKPIDAVTDCSKTAQAERNTLNEWVVLFHPKHKTQYGMLEDDDWKSGHPNRACSDQGRYAMAFDDGAVISVPIFDRLPVICVRGEPPLLPTSSGCLKNSESNGNNGCKCKQGYKDLADPKSWENQEGNGDKAVKQYADSLQKPSGYLCILDTCEIKTKLEKMPYDAIFFVIDGSSSIKSPQYEQMQKFLYSAHEWLPKNVRIVFQQYDVDPRCKPPKFQNITSYGEVGPGWNTAQYDRAVKAAVEKQCQGATYTYTAIKDATNNWLKRRAEKALMIVITDGQPDPRDTDHKLAIIEKMRKSGIDLKIVPVGEEGEKADFNGDVLNLKHDLIRMESYEKLAETLQQKLTQAINCSPITKAEIDEAKEGSYE